MAQSDAGKDDFNEAELPHIDDDLDLDLVDAGIDEKHDGKNKTPEKLHIIEEITDLLSNEKIANAVENFKADTEEKEIAVEFAKSHVLFIENLVDNDNKKGISRSEVEIRDVVSNANIMLKNKDEYLFSTMVFHSPLHYKSMVNTLLAKKGKKDSTDA
ncbi:MAG: hypothetical protein JW864_06070 [Spirochaetes bacterium]|nr:hypothetical protein [Spirochaetota bacterium]